MKTIIITIVIFLSTVTVNAQADTSLYLKGYLGASGLVLSGDEITVKGEGIALSAAVGAKIGPSVAIYAEWNAVSVSGLTINYGGDSARCPESVCSMSLGSDGIPGIGIGLYSKSNFNLHASVHKQRLWLDIAGEKSKSDERGTVVNFSTGKDWHTMDNVNMGVACVFGIGVPDEDGTTLGSFSLVFNTTYN